MSADQRRAFGYLLLLSLIAATSWSVWETATRRKSVPTRATWSAATDMVRDRLRPGDKVTWYPEWAGEARLSLHGLPILALPHRGEVDLGSATRLWVLGAFEYDGRKLARGEHLQPIQAMRELSYERVSLKDSGGVTVSSFSIGGEKVEDSLYDDLSDQHKVEVFRSLKRSNRSLQDPMNATSLHERCDLWGLEGWHCASQHRAVRQRIARCLTRPQSEQLRRRTKRRDVYTLDRRRWLPYVDCKLHPTEHVSRDWRVIGETPRRCVSMSPHQGREVEIKWWPKESDQPRMLWFSYGWEDLSVRHPFRDSRAEPIWLSIRQGSEVLIDEEVSPTMGWARIIKSIRAADKEGPPPPIRLSYRAPKGVEDATLCISLDVRL